MTGMTGKQTCQTINGARKQNMVGPLLHTHCRCHTETPFTQKPFCTHTILHRDALTHKPFYTQTLLHTEAFTHKPFYTDALLHTNTFTHKHLDTETLLHTNPFTHKHFYTQKLLHSDTFTHTLDKNGSLYDPAGTESCNMQIRQEPN